MIGQSHIFIGLIVVLISLSALFYIFNSLQKLSTECQCRVDPLVAEACRPVCTQMSSLTIPTMSVLLIISGFVIVICTTIYIILSR